MGEELSNTWSQLVQTMRGRLPEQDEVSLLKKGSQVPDYIKQKISRALTGRKLSLEHRLRLSQVRKGRIVSRETRIKLSIAQIGKPRWSVEDKLSRSGEGNAHHILTDENVIEMRQLYATGRYTLKSLAERYRTTESNVSRIVNRKTWKHLL
jgi:hypothetical protein